jgi:hypothetical protein
MLVSDARLRGLDVDGLVVGLLIPCWWILRRRGYWGGLL